MRFKRRFKLSEQQRNEMWSRWKAGQSLHEIGRVFGKDHVSIQFMLAQHGGIAPAAKGGARRERWHWQSERKSHEGLRRVGRFVK